MKKQLAKFAQAAVLGFAITFTLNACEEKEKKQDGTTATETAATQQPTQEAAAPPTQEAVATETKPPETVSENQPSDGKKCGKEGPPITIEAVFLENDEDDPEGRAWSDYRLPNGNEIKLNGFAPDDVKKGDKVSVTYQKIENLIFGEGDVMECADFNLIISMKKI